MIMLSSEIVVSKVDTAPVEDQHNVKLRKAYLRERKIMEHIDIELNRENRYHGRERQYIEVCNDSRTLNCSLVAVISPQKEIKK